MTAVSFHPSTVARPASGWLPLLAIARPFLILAALAFFAGFGGYLILGPPQVLSAAHAAKPIAAPSATPASEDAAPQWDLPKQV